MFVTRKRFIATENQLQSCRQLLAARHGELMAIRKAASANGGIYKCILECRELAHELREQLPADQDGHSPYLFDKLALIDSLLSTLAALLPPQDEARPTARMVAAGDVQEIYRGTQWATYCQERRA
ncbi:hypothetical protein [Serratia marcescens]|uniref:hypothetical protein n=1 Tax=Serratia marcescens TaxID=615 RepID=UPI0034D6BE69